MNILENEIEALEASNEGRDFEEIHANSNRITIETEAIGDRVVARIRDNGKGMPEVVRQQIIVEKHGDKIEVSSTPRERMELTIVLKAVRDARA